MNKDIQRYLYFATASLALLPCGCAQAPAFDVMGSLFPAWILCIALGILLAAIAHWLLVRYRVRLLLPVIAYPCLAAVFTFTIWLIFF
jgi:YtcA family